MKPIRRLVCDVGDVFGSWTVISELESDNYSVKRCYARCKCGFVRKVRFIRLRDGKIDNCLKHRPTPCTLHDKSPELAMAHRIWKGMKKRCRNKNDKGYPHYGGRGITVCERWNKFDAFLADMGLPEDGLSIDRINNDGDYTPTNCRWATKATQSRNKRSTKITENIAREIRLLNSGGLRASQIAETFKVSHGCVSAIISRRTWKDVV